MDQIYALGVSCIQSVQYWFDDYSDYFEAVNQFSDPHNILEILFPLVSILDSVFASQLIIVLAFGTWMSSILKWWTLEDRPYWWVNETYYYKADKPYIEQTTQTCMTSPGNPSGHTTAAASVLILFVMWISHVFNDRKWEVWWWKYITYPLFGIGLGSVMLARMYVATHFPHQCFFGALLGLFLSPALCIYLTDPYIWQYGPYTLLPASNVWYFHTLYALITTMIGVVTFHGLNWCRIDPSYSIKMAFKWCRYPETIDVSTTPMFYIVKFTANLLGCSLCVAPEIAKYRHYTKNRSLLISMFVTIASIYGFIQLEKNITTFTAFRFYMLNFILNIVRPVFYLKFVPALAIWPYRKKKQQ